MTKNKFNKQGYILFLSLMLLSILFVVVNSMFYNGTAHIAFVSNNINREKAKMLALAGIQLAIDKISLEKPTQKELKEAQERKKPPMPPELLFLKKILPIINRPININLHNINSQINITICCENGKININKIYDYSTHKFFGEGLPKGDQKKIIQQILTKLENIIESKKLFNDLQEFLKKRKYPLNDVTELLEIPSFTYFKDHVFYNPLLNNNKTFYLTDIFTIWTDNNKIEPWLFSNSLGQILGFKAIENNDIIKRKETIDQWLKNFKTNIIWQMDWNNILKPVYGKEFMELPKEFDFILNTKFTPNIFSVISYGTVEKTTQRVFSILQILGDDIKIKKLYWI